MMSPENERRQLLAVAIDRATQELGEPLDRIEVTAEHVTCSSGPRRVVMGYTYAQGGTVEQISGRFMPLPGSGSWEVIVLNDLAAKRSNRFSRAFSILLGLG